MQTVYEAVGGDEALLALANAWHTRVLQDEVVSHAFGHGYHSAHTARLAAYWAEALGGPTTYSDRYGDETFVVRMHSGNGPHEEMDRRAIACFDRALDDTGLARDERIRRVLHDYFAWATTTTMARYHRSAEDVPIGLPIPKWSWHGLVGAAAAATNQRSDASGARVGMSRLPMPALIQPVTKRLLLRQWRPADRAPFAKLNADPRVMEYFPSTLTREQSDAMADRCESLIAERGWGFWAVERKADGRFIGFVGLHVPAAPLPFSPCTEVGWRLAVEHWGHGFATEAALEALRVGFEVLRLAEIVSFTVVGNRKSRAVMERLGMTQSGLFEHPNVPAGSPVRQHCLYRLTAQRYRERSGPDES
jgi:RimJ/RimL family protein N-acetyltransferase/truncated hemoglobin YjbI